uniref:Uncharacterized protein n=2 Tax=Monodelphis domestica TaxID=13616 RepID=K7E5K5_MONDO
MASYLISNLYEGLKCPICLDFFTCTTSIECGHTFCTGCLYELIMKTSKSKFSCPKCLKKCRKTFRPNQPLEAVAQSFRLLRLHMGRNLQLRHVIKRKFQEEICLDPETAHPGIILSEDMKTMKGSESWKKLHCAMEMPTQCGTVLATQSFTSGRHYWEVTVGKSSAWDVGLCKTSISKTGQVSPCPSTGFWLLSRRQNNYLICTRPRTVISLKEKFNKVGIFLDYEAEEIVFYDVDNRCQIYTFTGSFLEPLWPIFSIDLYSKDENLLTIDPISDEAEEAPEHDHDTCLEISSTGEPQSVTPM